MDDDDAKVESSESDRVKLIRLDSAGRSRHYDAMPVYIYLSLISSYSACFDFPGLDLFVISPDLPECL